MAAKEQQQAPRVPTAVAGLKQAVIKGGLLASALFGGSLAGQQQGPQLLPWAQPGAWRGMAWEVKGWANGPMGAQR